MEFYGMEWNETERNGTERYPLSLIYVLCCVAENEFHFLGSCNSVPIQYASKKSADFNSSIPFSSDSLPTHPHSLRSRSSEQRQVIDT